MQVFVSELGDSSVTIGARVWVPTDLYWDMILNSYQVKNHFVEIKTLKETYKGKLKEISQDKIILNASIIKDKVIFEAVSIDLSSVILISFETSELMLLEKYSS